MNLINSSSYRVAHEDLDFSQPTRVETRSDAVGTVEAGNDPGKKRVLDRRLSCFGGTQVVEAEEAKVRLEKALAAAQKKPERQVGPART